MHIVQTLAAAHTVTMTMTALLVQSRDRHSAPSMSPQVMNTTATVAAAVIVMTS